MNSPWSSALHTGAVFRLSIEQNPFLEIAGDLFLWGIKKWRKRAEFGQYICRRVRSCNIYLLEPIWVFCKNFKMRKGHLNFSDCTNMFPQSTLENSSLTIIFLLIFVLLNLLLVYHYRIQREN